MKIIGNTFLLIYYSKCSIRLTLSDQEPWESKEQIYKALYVEVFIFQKSTIVFTRNIRKWHDSPRWVPRIHGSVLKGQHLGLEPCCEIGTIKWHESSQLLAGAQLNMSVSCLSTQWRAPCFVPAHFCPWGVVPGAGWTLHVGKTLPARFVKTTSHVAVDLYNTCKLSYTSHRRGKKEERRLMQCSLTSVQND